METTHTTPPKARGLSRPHRPVSPQLRTRRPRLPPTGTCGCTPLTAHALFTMKTEHQVSGWSNLNTISASTYQSPNFLINGGFDIWQRGTSSTTSAAYLADRWTHLWSAGTATVSRSTDVPETTLPYSLSLASTSGTNPILRQNIESVNALPLVGRTVTFSIWAKSTVGTGGLNWVTAFPTTTADTFSATTQDQSGTFTASMTVGTWTRYSATFVVGAGAVRGYLVQVLRNVTTTSTTTLYAGAQLELGSFTTPFRRNAPNVKPTIDKKIGTLICGGRDSISRLLHPLPRCAVFIVNKACAVNGVHPHVAVGWVCGRRVRCCGNTGRCGRDNPRSFRGVVCVVVINLPISWAGGKVKCH